MVVVMMAAFAARYPEEASSMTEETRESYRALLEMQMDIGSDLDVEDLWRRF